MDQFTWEANVEESPVIQKYEMGSQLLQDNTIIIENPEDQEVLKSILSIRSEYQRRKEILNEEREKQKQDLKSTSKERKSEQRKAYYTKECNVEHRKDYNAAYKKMNQAKIKTYEQLMNPKADKGILNETAEEEEKRNKKREADHKKYLRQKERLAEKKASMTEEQLLALHEKQHQANKQKEEKRKTKLRAYEDLVREGKAEKIGICDFGYTESKQAPSRGSLTDEQKNAHLVQRLERNAQRKREASAKARVTQTAKNKAELFSLKMATYDSEEVDEATVPTVKSIIAWHKNEVSIKNWKISKKKITHSRFLQRDARWLI